MLEVETNATLQDIGNDKVMFDGLFQNGMNKYLEPDEQTVSLIKNGLHPIRGA